MEFKEGDVVRLKSGGPDMTVEQIGEHYTAPGKQAVFCVWFEIVAKQRVVKREIFSPAVLEAVDYSPEPITMRPDYF